MFQQYGRITYPVHNHFDDMVIHPPTHYVVIGAFLRLGLSLPHAAAVEPAVILLIGALLLIASRFPLAIKFGFLFGTFLGALIWNDLLTVRPDLTLALAWTVGLIALESGRLSDWSHWRLAIGSILLVYASAVHYPGIVAQSGILVYAAWALFSLPRGHRLTRIAALAAGPILVGIPYLVLFVIPFRNQIWATITEHQGEGGSLDALRHHIETYQIWLRYWAPHASYQPFVQRLLFPLWFLHIPVALVGPSLFALFRATRVLSIAALPHLLFIVFAARHKQPGYTGYFAPESILYLAGLFSAFVALVIYGTVRVKPRAIGAIAAILILGGLTALILRDKPGVTGDRIEFTRNLNDLDVGRAISRAILGPNSFIGTTSAGIWYTGGEAHYYNLTGELLYPATIAGFQPKPFFSLFDAVVVDADQSWATWNKERVNVFSYFVSGDLNLKGFWFGDRRLNSTSAFSLLALTSDQGPVSGFATKRNQTFRFEPKTGGDSVLYGAVCPMGDLVNRGQFDFYATYYLPWKTNDDPRGVNDRNDPRSVIRIMLVTLEQLRRDVLPVAGRCKMRYQIDGQMTPVDIDAMTRQLSATDRPIRFYRNLAEALGGGGHLASRERVPDAIKLDAIEPFAGANVSKIQDGVELTTSPVLESEAAVVAITNVNGLSSGYVYLRARDLKGMVGVNVCDKNGRAEPEVMWEAHDPVGEIFIPVHNLSEVNRLVLRNMQFRAPSRIVLQDIAIVTAK